MSVHPIPTPAIHCLIIKVPQEVLQKIAFYATLASPLGPPKELHSLLLTCRTFKDHLSPHNASELYFFILSQKFDVQAPIFRLSAPVVREQAGLELRRRFDALKLFKTSSFDAPELTQALWIAYLMVEDTDTSQKNVKQLLRAGLPSFLDTYLRRRLYDGSEDNGGWPVVTEQNSLAIALSWTLASQSSINREERTSCDQMRDLLRPIVFGSSRYSIFAIAEDAFDFSGEIEPVRYGLATGDNVQTDADADGFAEPEGIMRANGQLDQGELQRSPVRMKSRVSTSTSSTLPPRKVSYFGTIQRLARPPAPAIFATLLYFVRIESVTPFRLPAHIPCKTRDEARQIGYDGVCAEDYEHFFRHCRTRFADFPAIDTGIREAALAGSKDTILCQNNSYVLGTLSGQWQGSQMFPLQYVQQSEDTKPVNFDFARSPLYITLEEHYCYDPVKVVPRDDAKNGSQNAWLPAGLRATETLDGIIFEDAQGTFRTTYETFKRGQRSPLHDLHGRRVVDVIITGKVNESSTVECLDHGRAICQVGGGRGSVLRGRVRMQDGLMALKRSVPADPDHGAVQQQFRGYVTSSQNLVGRVKWGVSPGTQDQEGVFSLGKNHNTSPPYTTTTPTSIVQDQPTAMS